MLWLPRWLREERATVVAEPDAPVAPLAPLSRRTFFFLGASAAVAAVAPAWATPAEPFEWVAWDATDPQLYSIAWYDDVGCVWHGVQRELYGRVTVSREAMVAASRNGGKGAFVGFVREETERALAGARREALRAGFIVPTCESPDGDGA